MTKREVIKRLLWLLFCIVSAFYGVVWIVFLPSVIASDFWRGVFYPSAVVMGIGHFLMAGTFFWYSVIKGGKE